MVTPDHIAKKWGASTLKCLGYLDGYVYGNIEGWGSFYRHNWPLQAFIILFWVNAGIKWL